MVSNKQSMRAFVAFLVTWLVGRGDGDYLAGGRLHALRQSPASERQVQLGADLRRKLYIARRYCVFFVVSVGFMTPCACTIGGRGSAIRSRDTAGPSLCRQGRRSSSAIREEQGANRVCRCSIANEWFWP